MQKSSRRPRRAQRLKMQKKSKFTDLNGAIQEAIVLAGSVEQAFGGRDCRRQQMLSALALEPRVHHDDAAVSVPRKRSFVLRSGSVSAHVTRRFQMTHRWTAEPHDVLDQPNDCNEKQNKRD